MGVDRRRNQCRRKRGQWTLREKVVPVPIFLERLDNSGGPGVRVGEGYGVVITYSDSGSLQL